MAYSCITHRPLHHTEFRWNRKHFLWTNRLRLAIIGRIRGVDMKNISSAISEPGDEILPCLINHKGKGYMVRHNYGPIIFHHTTLLKINYLKWSFQTIQLKDHWWLILLKLQTSKSDGLVLALAWMIWARRDETKKTRHHPFWHWGSFDPQKPSLCLIIVLSLAFLQQIASNANDCILLTHYQMQLLYKL